MDFTRIFHHFYMCSSVNGAAGQQREDVSPSVVHMGAETWWSQFYLLGLSDRQNHTKAECGIEKQPSSLRLISLELSIFGDAWEPADGPERMAPDG